MRPTTNVEPSKTWVACPSYCSWPAKKKIEEPIEPTTERRATADAVSQDAKTGGPGGAGAAAGIIIYYVYHLKTYPRAV